jgi:hypothetical protein
MLACSSKGADMFGYIGAHYEIMALVAFGFFTTILGYQSIADAIAHRT